MFSNLWVLSVSEGDVSKSFGISNTYDGKEQFFSYKD